MSKKINLFALLLAVAFGLLYACSKTDQLSKGQPLEKADVVSLETAKSWYSQRRSEIRANSNAKQQANISYPGIPVWAGNNAIDFGNGFGVLRIPLEGYPIPAIGYRDLLFQKANDGGVKNVVIQVMPDSSYLWRKVQQKPGERNIRYYVDNEDFTGDILLFTFSGRLIKGRKYKDGKLVNELLPSNSSSLNIGNSRAVVTNNHPTPSAQPFVTMLTEDDGEWGTPVYHDPVIITPPPSNPPPTPTWIFPPDGYDPANPTTGYPIGGGSPSNGGEAGYPPVDNPYSTQSICAQSFKFQKVIDLDEHGVGGYQIAAVTYVHMNVVDFKTGQVRIITPGPTLYFGMPIINSAGKFFNTSVAGSIAAQAVSKAEKDVMDRYHAGASLDFLVMNSYFKERISFYMKQKGGSAMLEPGMNVSGVTPTKAQYSGFFGKGCL